MKNPKRDSVATAQDLLRQAQVELDLLRSRYERAYGGNNPALVSSLEQRIKNAVLKIESFERFIKLMKGEKHE